MCLGRKFFERGTEVVARDCGNTADWGTIRKEMEKQTASIFIEIREFVKKIPRGKVATYGQIAKALEIRDVRKVGWALHANKDINCPCHRVVNKDGRLAPGYAFGGADEQKKKLICEGVIFKDEAHVDLEKSGVYFLK